VGGDVDKTDYKRSLMKIYWVLFMEKEQIIPVMEEFIDGVF